MVYAHDGQRPRSVATARAGDGSFLFLSRPALDFAITGGIGGYESLHSVIDIQSWVRAAFQISVDVSPADWDPALALRAAIWQLVRARLEGARLPAGAISVINTAARSSPMARQLDGSVSPDPSGPSGHAPAWHWHTPVTVLGVLSTVARDAIEVLAVENGSRLRECAADECALIFYDDSRSGRRRWCAAQRCGDRTRARDYRSRQRTTK
ncbi:MAG: ABATE domain-containing protein [Actinomycetota bacterium]|nr:ABATE domain-containing protein [Actinomycetota bacterium]